MMADDSGNNDVDDAYCDCNVAAVVAADSTPTNTKAKEDGHEHHGEVFDILM